MTQDEITALAQALVAALTKPGTGGVDPLPSDPYAPFPYGERQPQVILGLEFMLRAPVNPGWRPSTTQFVFRMEPSNGDKLGLPLRNSSGWPLWYTRERRAVIPHGDRMWDTQAEVDDYIRRVAVRDANLQQVLASWSPE